MLTGVYLHDPPSFNSPFFMIPPFSESQKVVTLPLFPPPLPPANFLQVPKLKMLGPLCNQTVNMKTDSKTLHTVFTCRTVYQN